MSDKATSEHFLAQIDRLIDWASLASMLHAISARVHADVPLSAVKMLLLARWYGMNDASLPEACQDRISFRRFLGLPLNDSRDDARLAEAFRRSAAQAPMEAQNLVHSIEAQLLSKGFTIKPGMWAEAAVVPMSPEVVLGNINVSDTTFFQPGEMAKLLKSGESVVTRCGEKVAENPPHTTGSGTLQPPAERESAPVQGIIEWPWGATIELKERLNIGREFGFCPFASELQPYRHVSRKHAELVVCGEGVWVRDLRSRNGTFVNNEEVPKGQAYLVDSDSRIRFGPSFVILLKLK